VQPIRGLDHSFTPVGEGNVVSVEFNLLYRWHSTLSEKDTEWFEESIFKTAFPDTKPSDVGILFP
jgi:linoleate 10R-lipoxygenase